MCNQNVAKHKTQQNYTQPKQSAVKGLQEIMKSRKKKFGWIGFYTYFIGRLALLSWTYFKPVILDTQMYSDTVFFKHSTNADLLDFIFEFVIQL